MRTWNGYREGLLLIGLWLWLGNSTALAQALSVPMDEQTAVAQSEAGFKVHYVPQSETLDVTASSVPLRYVLDAITEKTGVTFHLPRNMNPIVSLSIENESLERAIKQIMKQMPGAPYNAAMIYVAKSDSHDPNPFILSEVRVLVGGSTAAGPVPAVSAVSRPVTPAPMLNPEELAARRAQRDAARAKKDAAKTDRQQSKRGGRGGESESSQPPAGQEAKGDSPAPAPSAPAAGSGASPRKRGR